MNFSQIVDASIAQIIGLTATERLVNANPAFVGAMVNKGYHLVERAALWKFSEAEADITATAMTRESSDLPADMGVPLMVFSERTQQPLEYFDERQRFYPSGDTGQVRAYGMWGGSLRWYPLPTQNETFKLRYYRAWPDLVNDEDEPVIPVAFHDLLIDYGSYHLALRLPPTGDRFLPNSAAQPYIEAFHASLRDMLSSDLVMKTFDEVPNYDFAENVLGLGEW